MRLFFRLLPTVVAGVRLGWGVLMWGWVGCALLVLLCALPWFELTVPGLTLKMAGLVYAFTLTGRGSDYFARRTQSPGLRRALLKLPSLARQVGQWVLWALLLNFGLTFIALFIVGWAALALLGWVVLFYPTRPDLDNVYGRVLFERGHQQLVLRDGKPVVVWPLAPGFNFVTYPNIEELDSTWTLVTPLTISQDHLTAEIQYYLTTEITNTQARLLAEARQARLDAAEEQRDQAKRQADLAAQEATKQRLGYDVLHFELNETLFSSNKERDLRQLREPLDSARYGLARLSPTGTLRLTTNQISPGDDALRLAITQFKGTGTYWLRLPEAGADTSTLQLRRYTAGTGTTFASRPTKPVRVEIIRFDPRQRVVEGTFAGRLFSPDGASLQVEEGSFSLRFTTPRPQPALPH